MKTTITLFFSLLILANYTLAYPITPRPLRLLVAEGQFIIVGYVTKTYENKSKKKERSSKTAKIAVLENLQGEIGKDNIEIKRKQPTKYKNEILFL